MYYQFNKYISRYFKLLSRTWIRAIRIGTGFGFIMACFFLGDFLQRALQVPAPGSVVGMAVLLLLLLLQTKIVPDGWIETPCTWLLQLLPACFVPVYVVLLASPTFWHRDCII